MIETWLNLFGLLLTGLGAFVAGHSPVRLCRDPRRHCPLGIPMRNSVILVARYSRALLPQAPSARQCRRKRRVRSPCRQGFGVQESVGPTVPMVRRASPRLKRSDARPPKAKIAMAAGSGGEAWLCSARTSPVERMGAPE